MKSNNFTTILLFLLLISLPFFGEAQNSAPYTFPIRPNKTNFLSGTMGELRSSHFHAGIDIKTGGKIGEPVHATKRGYITRIKVSTYGYGNALYMLHPDGNTSVYAHLNEFTKEIQDYVRAAQYKRETFEIELFPQPYQFAYQAQDVIGISGNTGGSLGPHLHFEIRDQQQRVLNPLHYGFKEIKDDIPPILQGFKIKPMNLNSRVGSQFKRLDVELTRNGFNYKAKDTIKALGEIGLELWGHDKLNGSANKNGISMIEVFINGKPHFKQNIDVMSFALQRHILVHYPYDIKVTEGSRYHKLYVDDGNSLRFYETENETGVLHIKKGQLYDITIKMYDPYNNMSSLQLIVQGTQQDTFLKQSTNFELDEIAYELDNKFLKVFAIDNCKDQAEKLTLHISNDEKAISPQYYLSTTAVYLWNLNNGIPDSLKSCRIGLNLPRIHRANPKESSTYTVEGMTIQFKPNTLFDTLYFETNYEIITKDSLEVFTLGPFTSPLKNSVEIKLSPKLTHYDSMRSHVYKMDDNGDFSFEGGAWTDEGIKFKTRELANYTILTDSVPPTVTALRDNLAFIIKDELSGINTFNAYLNGKWLLMKYEPKNNIIWVDWPNEAIKKTGDFVLRLTDNAGNTTEYTTKL